MSVTGPQALGLATALLDALVADTKAVSAVVADLEQTIGRDWTEADERKFAGHLDTLAELCGRYRSGHSLTLRKRVSA